MNIPRLGWCCSVMALVLTVPNARAQTPREAPAATSMTDLRDIRTGSIIPDEGYSDQPYTVITNDGNWLCVLTTGGGKEGEPGQHIVATISSDKGRTWSKLIDIEPSTGPEASWVMPLKVPGGRVYVFYTYNSTNIREVINTNADHTKYRVDTLGKYMFKFSDDNGRTWSKQRYDIPLRKMRIDYTNNYKGDVLFFWGVGKPIVHNNSAYFGFAKVGRWDMPGGSMVTSQGCFMRSDNILSEKDPNKIRWQLLPDGEEGLRAPKGPVSDEANLVALSDGSLYATYRTIDGYNCHAYSRDGGHTWTPSAYATYTPSGGRRIKHPRAANFVRKFSNGKYLLWFHNHGGEAALTPHWTNFATGYYRNRNPAWVAGGIEKDGYIHWSEPEIVLYDIDPAERTSYPDFIEESGRYYITETNKTIARVHEVDSTLLEGMWNQFTSNQVVAQKGLVLDVSGKDSAPGSIISVPQLPNLAEGRGFTLDFRVRFDELTPEQTLLDTRDGKGKGIALITSDSFTIKLILNDGTHESAWESDPGTHEGTLKTGKWQHVTVIVDGGPKIVTFVVDGVLNDGGAARQFGWGRFKPQMGDVNGMSRTAIAPKLFGEVKELRIYNRYLRTSEAVGNFRAGL